MIIEKKWNKLKIEDFCKYIENMLKSCKLIILAKKIAIKY